MVTGLIFRMRGEASAPDEAADCPEEPTQSLHSALVSLAQSALNAVSAAINPRTNVLPPATSEKTHPQPFSALKTQLLTMSDLLGPISSVASFPTHSSTVSSLLPAPEPLSVPPDPVLGFPSVQTHFWPPLVIPTDLHCQPSCRPLETMQPSGYKCGLWKQLGCPPTLPLHVLTVLPLRGCCSHGPPAGLSTPHFFFNF